MEKTNKKTFFNLSLFQFLTFLRRGIFYTFMINYLFILMQTVTSTATLGTLNMIGSATGQNFLWARICDRRKIRTKLIVMGETIAAFAYLLVFLAHRALIAAGNNFNAGLVIILGLSALEFFWSMSDVGWAALLTDVTTSEVRGRVVGVLNFIASLGRMAGILCAGVLYSNGEGFQNGTIFYLVIILLLIGASLMTFTSRWVKEGKSEQKETRAHEKAQKTEPKFENRGTYKWFLISLVIIILGASSINQIFLLFIKLPTGLNVSDSQMSLILSAWTIGGMIASLGAGRLSDRIGRCKVLLAGLTIAVLTPIAYNLAYDVASMSAIYALNGISFWTIQTVGFVFAGDIIPEHSRGRLLGRYNTVMALSWGPAGVLIGGPLADTQVRSLGLQAHAAYVNAFYASSAILILGTAIFIVKVVRTETAR
jgi:MFS family permease